MLRLLDIRLHRMPLRARMPFRYGIATLTDLPHLFLSLDAEIDGQRCIGMASDHLPPRWFTKDPSQTPEEEIEAMLHVIRHAAMRAIDSTAETPFDWWLEAYDTQMSWARSEGIPALLAHFGVSLVERALLSAFCHARRTPFHRLLLEDQLGFTPEQVYPELAGVDWRSAFPQQPRSKIFLRHTVGLSDPIAESEIPAGLRLADGLPQSLEASIRAYGLRHFKIKLQGDLDADRERLSAVLSCIESEADARFAFSVDGNESYREFETFRDSWADLTALPAYRRHADKLLFVEQPVHRAAALDSRAAPILAEFAETPVIIDESDATIDSLPAALNLGYCGTSHKNCKGVFKGLAAKCLLTALQAQRSSSLPPLRQSGEDLSNIGPVALLQDLTVMATLDIASVERNGHHYFAGLSAFSPSVNHEVAESLPSLYTTSKHGFTTLAVDRGELRLGELLKLPFAPIVGGLVDNAQNVSLAPARPAD